MNQLKEAKKGKATKEIKEVAKKEPISLEEIKRKVAKGKIVIPKNRRREPDKVVGIGEGLRTKINANIGTSPDYSDIPDELEKARVAVENGSDTIMDLSIGDLSEEVRKKLISNTETPLGTVPIYSAFMNKNFLDISSDHMFKAIREHVEDGVDFITVHCGVTLDTIESLKDQGRLMDLVSRGGSFLSAWMLENNQENPLYAEFDYLLEIAKEYDVTLSLGDGLRPGCINDASDKAQFQELYTLGELVERSRERNVQAMVEGPGHVPLDQIELNVKMEKEICNGAPFYVLGPLVTDIAPGYDHLVGAIGGAVAAWKGADFLCYVTPSEHLCLPNSKDVEEGVVASKIAAHSADIANGIDKEIDKEMSDAREDFDWEKQFDICINPKKARNLREDRPAELDPDTCSMCSNFCALKIAKEHLSNYEKN